MNFMMTAAGREYHFDQSGPRPVQIEAIAHQLSMLNRFHGATRRPYSVAEHSLLVSEIAQREGHPAIVQYAGLMHDAHEVFTQDLASPAKRAVNLRATLSGGTKAWEQFENEHARNLRSFFGLLTVFTSRRGVLHRFDLQALATERRDLMPYDSVTNLPWEVLGDREVDPSEVIAPVDWLALNTAERAAMVWTDWRDRFLDRFAELRFELELAQNGAAA